MPDPPRTGVLRLTPASVIRAVAMLGLTLAVLAVIAASARVIGWILAAVVIAGLLYPTVQSLSARIPRALALFAVVFGALALTVGIGYAVVDEVVDQMHDLQTAVPRAARELERSDRFGEAATEIHLARRAKVFVDELPERLRGGNVQDALRSAATRGVAFLATGVMSIFFLMYGEQLLRGAVRQLPARRQANATRIGLSVYHRSWRYVSGSLTMAVAAGLIAYLCAMFLHLPGKAPLALWMVLLDPIPLLGVLLGALPLILLAATTATWQGSVLVAAVLVGWQLFEAVKLQPTVEARSLHLGPFITIAVVMVGLELYGIGGAIIGLVFAVVLAATLDELVGHGPHSAKPSLSSNG
jgi:predicted PurR-regulated permease PerM